jgi:tetraacyldisaccharide 4'-kinase
MKTYRIVFLPIALIYVLIVKIRHLFFDIGIFKSETYKIPTIGVGNLILGGSGKTPHVEHLVRMLSDEFKVAILSRGYGRKSKGYLKANQYSKYEDIGDEPMQYYRKFQSNVIVAVDGNRRNGIKNLMEDKAHNDVILLDDSFQHRYVKPGISILLTDNHKLYKQDYIFPVGKLRDTVSAAKRADIIIVTKTDKVLSPITRRNVEAVLKPEPHQSLYFSYISYGNFVPLSEIFKGIIPSDINTILLFTGIANPYPLQEHLRYKCTELVAMDFPDHHDYKKGDFVAIRNKFEALFTRKKIIVTTEKDAMRLINSPYLCELNNLPVFFLPIEMKLHKQDRENFRNQIIDYVRENKLNR